MWSSFSIVTGPPVAAVAVAVAIAITTPKIKV